MNKEKFMELVSEAWDVGACFHIHFGQYDPGFENVPMEKARKRIKLAELAIGERFRFEEGSNDHVGSFVLSNNDFYIASSFINEELQ